MPRRLPRPCSRPGCPELTTERWCDLHRQQEGRSRAPGASRHYGTARWQRLRLLVLHRDPVCVVCGEQPATEADHIIPLARGGDDSMVNLQGVCLVCHSRKTATEGLAFGRCVDGEGGSKTER